MNMVEYQVYGVGNALLDMEFSVPVELLENLKIDKGVMTLINEDQEQELVAKLSQLPSKKSSGGSAANTLVAFSQFGGLGFYSCKVANDESGHFFLKDLKTSGLDTNLQSDTLDNGITGKCLVFVTPDADRTMNTFLGITSEIVPADLLPEAILGSQYLYLEGYLTASATGLDTVLKAKEIAHSGNVKVAFSLSDPNMVEYFSKSIQKVIEGGLDLIFANEEESFKLAKTNSLTESIAYLQNISRGFALTLGSRGSLVYYDGELIEINPVQVQAIDTVGAGDMYAGAFLYGLTQGMGAQRSGELASKASARIVTHFGPRLSKEDVQSLLIGF